MRLQERVTNHTHNDLNQLDGQTDDGAVLVRGSTDESATVKMKTSLATEWENARLLEGNIFEKDMRSFSSRKRGNEAQSKELN